MRARRATPKTDLLHADVSHEPVSRRTFVLALLGVAGAVCGFQLGRYQVFGDDRAENELYWRRVYNQTLYAKRGTIYDRNGNVLTSSESCYDIAVNPSQVDKKNKVIRALMDVLDVDEKTCNAAVNGNSYAYIQRKVDTEEGKKLDLSIANDWSWVGLSNYIKSFTADRDFWNSLKVTGIYVFIAVPCKLVFALFIAMVLNMKIRGIRFFQTLYYIPSILGGSVAVSVIWRFMFSHDGLVNTLTSYLGLPALDWLGSKALALPTVSLLAVWQFGSSMVLFLVGLKQIPVSLYEAASIDGASKVHQFFKITLPMLTPTVLFNVIMQTIGAFQEFTSAFIITGGGPMNSTYMYGMMLYNNSFKYYKMGYASAQSWILFIIIMVITLIQFRGQKKWVNYM